MAAAPPLLGDRPLARGEDDLLGFERVAEVVAHRLDATSEGGLLVAARATHAGQGRTSFLNLLHAALASRQVATIRLEGEPGVAALARWATVETGSPRLVALLDDVPPSSVAQLRDLPLGGPQVVATWLDDPTQSGAPLVVDLPAWDAAASERLAERLGAEVDREHWARALAGARTPRRARRIANAALAASDALRLPLPDVLAALAARAGPVAGRDPAIDEAIAPWCGALEERADAPAEGAPVPLALATTSETAPAPSGPRRPASPDERGGDEIDSLRKRCAQLGRVGGPAAIAELVRCLSDERAGVRLSASRALAGLGDDAVVPAVRPLLGAADPTVRRAAAFVLGGLADESSREDLEHALEDPAPETRRAAAAALAKLGGPRAARCLLAALEDDHAGVRMAVETALVAILPELPEGTVAAYFTDPELATRRAALAGARRLGLGSRAVVETLLADPSHAAAAAAVLGARQERASLPSLARAAASPDQDTRVAALDAAARCAGVPSAEAIASLLVSEHEEERSTVPAALASCAGALDAILPYLAHARPEVRSAAADALGRCGDPRAMRPLLDAHAQDDASVRRAAAAGLVRLGFGD